MNWKIVRALTTVSVFFNSKKVVIIIENKMNYSEIIASLMLFGTGIFTMTRGIFWVIETDESMFDSQLYTVLSYAMPLWMWGLLFLFGGLFSILASWRLPKRETAKNFAWFLLLGGLISSLSYFVITVAGFGNASNWMTPVQYIILSGVNGVLAFLGGVRIWLTKNTS